MTVNRMTNIVQKTSNGNIPYIIGSYFILWEKFAKVVNHSICKIPSPNTMLKPGMSCSRKHISTTYPKLFYISQSLIFRAIYELPTNIKIGDTKTEGMLCIYEHYLSQFVHLLIKYAEKVFLGHAMVQSLTFANNIYIIH